MDDMAIYFARAQKSAQDFNAGIEAAAVFLEALIEPEWDEEDGPLPTLWVTSGSLLADLCALKKDETYGKQE